MIKWKVDDKQKTITQICVEVGEKTSQKTENRYQHVNKLTSLQRPSKKKLFTQILSLS